jgi:hypothetical protein
MHAIACRYRGKIVSFWARFLQNENGLIPNKLSYFFYNNVLRNTVNDNDFERNYPWIYYLNSILIKCGLKNVWNDHNFPGTKLLKLTVRQKLKDIFLNEWYSMIN